MGLRDATLATEQLPPWSSPWLRRAWCEAELGRHGDAASSFAKALELQSLPAVRADYAEQLHLAGDERGAVAQYRKAREEQPDLPTAFCGEALLRLDARDPDLRDRAEAVRLMERAVELVPDSSEYRAHLERARSAMRDTR